MFSTNFVNPLVNFVSNEKNIADSGCCDGLFLELGLGFVLGVWVGDAFLDFVLEVVVDVSDTFSCSLMAVAAAFVAVFKAKFLISISSCLAFKSNSNRSFLAVSSLF